MKQAWVCLFVLGAGGAEAKGPEPFLNKKGEVLVGQLNLNEATAAQLVELPGIGPVLAERIVSWRQKKPFKRAEELMRVKGFGRKRFSRLKPHLRIAGPTELKWQAKALPPPEQPPLQEQAQQPETP
ncbi:MAG: helix-hairpin-helix domain-containing protein [Cystobacterineae bacterium]|nr:helix-hairpin-helix domain-containing protein [Cystobacterineae bacterium]